MRDIYVYLKKKNYFISKQATTNPYLTGIPANSYNPYFPHGHLVPTLLGPDPSVASPLGPVVQQAVPVAQQKIPRSDRLEVSEINCLFFFLT